MQHADAHHYSLRDDEKNDIKVKATDGSLTLFGERKIERDPSFGEAWNSFRIPHVITSEMIINSHL